MDVNGILEAIPDGTLAVVLVVWLFLRYWKGKQDPPPPPE